MTAIGILGGMGPQASARLYELLIEGSKSFSAAAFDDDYPEIVLLSAPVPNFISNKKQLTAAKLMLVERTKLLEKAGCIVNGIACNTAHILLPELQGVTGVPFLSIPELVADKINTSGFKRVGLLATPTTLESTLYDNALNNSIQIIRPSAAITKQIEIYIYKQLGNRLSQDERLLFRQLVRDFMRAKRLDAIILGCTELPLVYEKSGDERIIDTLQVLADSLLKFYFDKAG